MIIKVTQKHIENVEETKCKTCPVALAIEEHYGFPVYVTTVAVYKDYMLSDIMHYLPSEVTDKIVNFDKGFGMTPFSFELI